MVNGSKESSGNLKDHLHLLRIWEKKEIKMMKKKAQVILKLLNQE